MNFGKDKDYFKNIEKFSKNSIYKIDLKFT